MENQTIAAICVALILFFFLLLVIYKVKTQSHYPRRYSHPYNYDIEHFTVDEDVSPEPQWDNFVRGHHPQTDPNNKCNLVQYYNGVPCNNGPHDGFNGLSYGEIQAIGFGDI